MNSEPVDNSAVGAPRDTVHARQIVVATDDPAILEAIELCLFDHAIQAHVLSWRDLPPRDADSTLDAIAKLAAQESRLLAVVAEYIRLARDTYATGGDPCRALDCTEEAVQRAAELNEGWRRLAG
jgi:hypothetical protein